MVHGLWLFCVPQVKPRCWITWPAVPALLIIRRMRWISCGTEPGKLLPWPSIGGHDGARAHRPWVHNAPLGPIMYPHSYRDLGCLSKAMHCRWSLWILHSGGNQLKTLRATKDSIDLISVFVCEERAMLKRRRWESRLRRRLLPADHITPKREIF